jgi:hypothetical protein
VIKMAYQVEMITELDGKSLQSGAEVIDNYISTKNCTGLFVGVQCMENATLPTAANIHTKMGTFEIVASSKDGGGTQVSLDADDIPPMMEKFYGKPMPGIYGSDADDQYLHFQYFLPLSPDPLSSKFGYRDARFVVKTSATQTASDAYKLYVAALLHDEKPQYYIQMLNRSFTASSGVNSDYDLPENQLLMGTYAMGTTSLQGLGTSDAPTIDQLAIVVNGSEKERVSTKMLHAYVPDGIYDVAGTVTSTAAIGGSVYVFWDLGYKRGYGIPIGKDWKIRVKPLASDAVRLYPMIAMSTGGV